MSIVPFEPQKRSARRLMQTLAALLLLCLILIFSLSAYRIADGFFGGLSALLTDLFA